MSPKFRIITLIFFVYVSLTGQEFTEPEKERLIELGIDYAQLLDTNPDYGADLRNVLKKDRKYRTNKTVGIVLGGVGIATTAGGILIMAKRNPENGLTRLVMGGGMTALGAIEMGVSLSLFSGSKKRKKERDQMLSEFNLEED